MFPFDYIKPKSIKEAIASFDQAEEPIYMAGGMTLIATMKQRLAQPSHIVDLSEIGGLKAIDFKDGDLTIGAMASHSEVAGSSIVNAELPALASLASDIGDPQVRARGTLGGSIANADPSADYPAALLALDAKINTNVRQLKADGFFKGLFETSLEEGEIITSVSFKKPLKAAYKKLSNPASRYAIVGVCVAQFEKEIRVGVTGAGACAFRWGEVEEALSLDFSTETLEGFVLPFDDLNEDVHASKPYRASLVKTMLKRGLEEILKK